ncbi:hypothetical protein [Bacillus cereus]|uniref:hypothetical protein n=1 Tax=Bacillus cereus TaxID=1396 RepID=UPI000BEE005F|nr:hypothetical protein [Bacillus cereus]MDR4194664.1 hypothetical protein [Bacillus cereus]MEB9929459.1 hypothetical protein [Bacillus cereus]PDY04512.1 hypothetical protein COM66_17650 [Bacillus cereus]PEA04797.1 hypothetical protein CON37_12100 [Bacillus cereus]
MGKIIGIILIIGGMIPLIYTMIQIYRQWKEKGPSFALKSIIFLAVSILLDTATTIILCIVTVFIGICLIIYT